MIVGHLKDVAKEPLAAADAEGARIQWLFSQQQGVPHFYMRYVTLEPGGHIPLHTHAPIHQIFVVKGRGAILLEDGEIAIEAGSFVYVSSGLAHGTRNTGEGRLEFICCINRTDE